MKTHLSAEAATPERQREPDRPAETARSGTTDAGISDARPQAAMQLRLRDAAARSPRSARLDTLQAMTLRKPAIQLKGTGTVQLRDTKIVHEFGNYGAPFANQYDDKKVGLKMHAELVPGKAVKGSEPARVNTPMYSALWKSNGIVRGHLLNHDLGGHGAPENLFPITSGANSRHSKQVEAEVKNQLHNAYNQNKKDANNDEWVEYDVKVIKNSNQNSGFACSWARKAGGKVIAGEEGKVNISSSFVLDTKSDGWSGSGSGRKTSGWAHTKGAKFDEDAFKEEGAITTKESADFADGNIATAASKSGANKKNVGKVISALQVTAFKTWYDKKEVKDHLKTLDEGGQEEYQEKVDANIEETTVTWLRSKYSFKKTAVRNRYKNDLLRNLEDTLADN